MTRERNIDRIRKLLALAKDGSAAQNEADIARSMAERLMAAAGISEGDLEPDDDDAIETFGASSAEGDGAAVRGQGHGRAVGWIGVLAVAVARVVGCYVHRDEHNVRIWVGTKAQRETAIALHTWAIDQVERLARGAKKIAKQSGNARAYMGAYRRGLASAIAAQARALVAHRNNAKPTGPALVRVSELENRIKAYCKTHGVRYSPDGRRGSYRPSIGGAFTAGLNDGRSVRLQHDVIGSSALRLTSGAHALASGGGE